MRLSAAAGLVLGCLLLVAVPLLAQLDAVYAQPDAAYTQPQQPQDGHLRLAGVRPAQLGSGLQGQTATYVGLGAAAEAALGDAEQVAEALLAADDATTATRKVRQMERDRNIGGQAAQHRNQAADDDRSDVSCVGWELSTVAATPAEQYACSRTAAGSSEAPSPLALL